MAKVYRRNIKIEGRIVSSPRFTGKDGKKQADDWYAEKRKEKELISRGMRASHAPTFLDYTRLWLKRRMETYPMSTWASDEQRLREYLLPELSQIRMDRITRTLMRDVLMRVQKSHELSITTRTRIKALASKIFTDAMNEKVPLVTLNPCSSLKFPDPRVGKRKPLHLQSASEVREFLLCAQSVGKQEALICAIAVMSGLRKSEIIPLRFKNILSDRIVVDHHCEQASLTIKPGTKAGTNETREVFVPHRLVQMIEAYRLEAKFQGAEDFVFADEKGEWIRPRRFHSMIDDVVKLYGKPITLHKLRHSYGRMFIERTGNARALQDLLGHKSPTTTAIYSELAGDRLQPFSEVMDVFEAEASVLIPSKTTPKRRQKKGEG